MKTGQDVVPLQAEAARRSRFVTRVVSVVLLAGGFVALAAFSPSPGRVVQPAAAAADPVIVAAGDIACDPTNSNFNGGNGTSGLCAQKATSALIGAIKPAAVLPLGDNQYYCGGLAAFQQSYALSWGQYLSKTYPVVGNHEYLTSGGTGCDSSNLNAAGHFTYFAGAAKEGTSGQGWYSFNVGKWHLIAINSNCTDAGGCIPSSPQGRWLAGDLAANTQPCTLAYWHIPLWSSGGRAEVNTASIVQQLYNAHADVILNGHDHIYERFAPQNAAGQLDAKNGIREFIAGTGGANHTSLATLAANSQITNTTAFGVLKLTLHPGSYDWKFVPIAGSSFTDSGTQTCHKGGTAPPPPPPPPPLPPSSLPTHVVLAGGSPGSVHVTYPIRLDLKVTVLRSRKGVRRVTSRLIRPRLLQPYFVLRVDGTMKRVRVRIILVGRRGHVRAKIVRVIPTNRPVRLAGLPVPSTTPSIRVAILG